MPDPLSFPADDGFISLKIGDAEKTVDLWRLHNRLAACWNATADKPTDERHEAIAIEIESLGFSKPSHKLAFQIMDRVAQLNAAALGKEPPAQSATNSPG